MKNYRNLTYAQKIKWRITGLWLLFAAMLCYMVIVGEMGLGDPRKITPFAKRMGSFTFFAGLFWVVYHIVQNKKLLKSAALLKEKMLCEQDERNRWLHDKSGGVVWDILFVVLLFAAMTFSLFNMPAFYTSFAILVLAAALKAGTYLFYSRRA